MRKFNYPVLVVSAAGMGLGFAEEAAKKIDVRMERPFKVGQSYHVELAGTAVQMSSMKNNDPEAGNIRVDTLSVEGTLSGIMEVKKTTAKGGIQQFDLTVESCLITGNLGEKNAQHRLQKGQIIHASREAAEKRIDVDGEIPSGVVREFLDTVLEVAVDGDEGKFDLAVGTDIPRAIGEKWKLDPKKLMENLPGSIPFTLDESATKGSAEFVRSANVSGEDCSMVRCNFEMKPTRLGPGDEMETISSNLQFQVEGAYPKNLAIPALVKSLKMELQYKGRLNASGFEAVVEMNTIRTSKETRRLLPQRPSP